MAAIDINKLKQGSQRFLSGFTTGQKVVTGLALVFLVIGAMWFSSIESKSSMAPLYTNLDATDASSVTQELDSQGIPYELTDGGRTIMIPPDQVYKVRIDLSAQGLPSNADSFALLDEGGITRSEFLQRIDYQRALQGELSNTIMAIDGVDAATVNISLPRDEIFVDDSSPQATAGVLIRMSSGAELSSEQVQSIVHLVSSSVPDLKPENVTLSDQSGQLYKELGSSDIGSASNKQIEQKLDYEQAMARSIEQTLARSLGRGNAVVAVSAELDFSEQRSQTREVTASGKNGKNLATSESTKTETYTGAPNTDAGLLGPDGQPIGSGNTEGDDYELEETDRNFDPNVTVTEQTNPPGRLVRQSVSVQLNESAVAPEDITTMEGIIAAAAGIDEERNDVLNVAVLPFDTEEADAAAAALEAAKPDNTNAIAGAIRYVATLLIIALVLFFAWRSVKKSQLAAGAPVRIPIDLAELEAADARGLPTGATAEAFDAARNRELVAAGERLRLDAGSKPVEQQIAELIDQQPEEVAQTLRSWLADRRS